MSTSTGLLFITFVVIEGSTLVVGGVVEDAGGGAFGALGGASGAGSCGAGSGRSGEDGKFGSGWSARVTSVGKRFKGESGDGAEMPESCSTRTNPPSFVVGLTAASTFAQPSTLTEKTCRSFALVMRVTTGARSEGSRRISHDPLQRAALVGSARAGNGARIGDPPGAP